jgi:hypothetical protein
MVPVRSKVASRVTSPFTKISHAMATMKVPLSMNPLVTRLGRAPTVHLCQEPWVLASTFLVLVTLPVVSFAEIWFAVAWASCSTRWSCARCW